jgi:hypothetical protein
MLAILSNHSALCRRCSDLADVARYRAVVDLTLLRGRFESGVREIHLDPRAAVQTAKSVIDLLAFVGI